ncbi:UDP-N-acetylglucosamine 1-carboxyvinyltransferase [Bacillus sp. FSL K6-3431]|uniref:UDP-N-acetylglucosamine 1-carboxyvinyltransferase n=1 Tax=Bacillus sp. FSL K6-3431 TaxID=2921500 RepID=UPI0030FBDB9D
MKSQLENQTKTKIKVNGRFPLQGTVDVDGAKNAVLPLIAAACLATDGVTTLENVPAISDVHAMTSIMDKIGVLNNLENTILRIESNTIKSEHIPQHLAAPLRQSILFLGVLVTTLGEAKVALPGGDKIGGNRPIDFHIDALNAFGVDISIDDGVIYAKAKKLPLTGGRITFRYPSFGATITALISATLAEGVTVIENAAMEPEIFDLINMLNKMGAKINGSGTNRLTVEGVQKLIGVMHKVIPDRIEAGTLLTAMAMTNGSGTIKGFIPGHNQPLLNLCRNIGLELSMIGNDSICIKKTDALLPFNVTTGSFPSVSSDLQPLLTSMATQCKGESIITDSVYNDRFNHIPELLRMGANIQVKGRSIHILGGEILKGSTVTGKDLRATSSLICAGLAATGSTFVYGLEHLHRGHGNLVKKLLSLGASIRYE